MTTKLISKQIKINYMTLIRPTETYGCETWTLSVRYVNNFCI